MRLAEKRELKILMGYAKLIEREETTLRRWKLTGTGLLVFGWFLLASILLHVFRYDFIPSSLLFMSFAAGLCIALGTWFSCMPLQWPVLKKLIDTERLKQRIDDMGDASIQR